MVVMQQYHMAFSPVLPSIWDMYSYAIQTNVPLYICRCLIVLLIIIRPVDLF